MARTFSPAEYIGALEASIRAPESAAPAVGCALVEAGTNQLGWTASPIALDSAVVHKSGDTMSGPLSMSGSGGTSAINLPNGVSVAGRNQANSAFNRFAQYLDNRAVFGDFDDGGGGIRLHASSSKWWDISSTGALTASGAWSISAGAITASSVSVVDTSSPVADRYLINGEASLGRKFGLYVHAGGLEGGVKADSQLRLKAGGAVALMPSSAVSGVQVSVASVETRYDNFEGTHVFRPTWDKLPLAVRAWSTPHTANLFEAQIANGTAVMSVSAAGAITASSLTAGELYIGTTGNIARLGTPGVAGDGVLKVMKADTTYGEVRAITFQNPNAATVIGNATYGVTSPGAVTVTSPAEGLGVSVTRNSTTVDHAGANAPFNFIVNDGQTVSGQFFGTQGTVRIARNNVVAFEITGAEIHARQALLPEGGVVSDHAADLVTSIRNDNHFVVKRLTATTVGKFLSCQTNTGTEVASIGPTGNLATGPQITVNQVGVNGTALLVNNDFGGFRIVSGGGSNARFQSASGGLSSVQCNAFISDDFVQSSRYLLIGGGRLTPITNGVRIMDAAQSGDGALQAGAVTASGNIASANGRMVFKPTVSQTVEPVYTFDTIENSVNGSHHIARFMSGGVNKMLVSSGQVTMDTTLRVNGFTQLVLNNNNPTLSITNTVGPSISAGSAIFSGNVQTDYVGRVSTTEASVRFGAGGGGLWQAATQVAQWTSNGLFPGGNTGHSLGQIGLAWGQLEIERSGWSDAALLRIRNRTSGPSSNLAISVVEQGLQSRFSVTHAGDVTASGQVRIGTSNGNVNGNAFSSVSLNSQLAGSSNYAVVQSAGFAGVLLNNTSRAINSKMWGVYINGSDELEISGFSDDGSVTSTPFKVFRSGDAWVSGNAVIRGNVQQGFNSTTPTYRSRMLAAGQRESQVFESSLGNWQSTIREESNAGGARLSIFGKTPVGQFTAPALATDLASAITAVNLHTADLTSFGLYA